jgi:hypothetical protein
MNGMVSMTEHEQNLRDLTAMFAMAGLIFRTHMWQDNEDEDIARCAYSLADEMMKARQSVPDEQGIAAIKPKRKYERKV